jgi:hypothetical protein
MKILSTVRAVVLTLLVALGSLVLAPAADAAASGARPSCVAVKVYETNPGGFYSKSVARLISNCSTTKHLKVIWHAGRDSACLAVKAGRRVSTQAQLTVSVYDKTVTC